MMNLRKTDGIRDGRSRCRLCCFDCLPASQKLGKNQRGPVHIDIDQTDMANQMGQMVECLSATGQTLERINERMDAAHDKITRIETLTDNINRVATKTGATAFEIRDSLKDEALERAAEARGAAKALAKVGD